MRRTLFFTALRSLSALLALALPVLADPEVCDRAARRAALAEGVPPDVLLAITRTETGRTRDGALQPWPWTVNMEGEGRWFDTPEAAQRYVFERFKSGARSFDVGCFQINYKWHGAAFRSIEDMFDPEISGLYAAALLMRLYSETGDWSQAAGAYHSRTPAHATRYRTRFDEIRAALTDLPMPRTSDGGARNNGFVLLQDRGDSGTLGSLVPLPGRGGGTFLRFDQRESL